MFQLRSSLPKSRVLSSIWCIVQFRILAAVPMPMLWKGGSRPANVCRNFEAAFRECELRLTFYRNHVGAVQSLASLQLLRVSSDVKTGTFFLENSLSSVKMACCAVRPPKRSSRTVTLCQFKHLIVQCVQSHSASWNTLCAISESIMRNVSFVTCMCLSDMRVICVLPATSSVYTD